MPLLNPGGKAIEIELPGPVKRATSTLKKSATAPAAATAKSENSDKIKRKLTVVNPEKSAFVPSLLGYVNSTESPKTVDSKVKEKATEKIAKDVKVSTKKRPIIESDDDSDLDFCEAISVKRIKMSVSTKSQKPDRNKGDCIVLDSDNENNDESEITGNGDAKWKNKVKGKSNIRKNSELSKFTEKEGDSLTNNISNGIIGSDGDE